MKCCCWECIGESAEGLLGLSGTVLMAGSRAVYCEMKNKELLLIHDAECGTVPFGIGVNNIIDLMQRADIEKGMRVATCKNCIDFSRTGTQIRRGMQRLKGAIEFDKPVEPEEIASIIILMKSLIIQHGSCRGLGDIALVHFSKNTGRMMPRYGLNVFCKAALPSVHQFTSAVRTNNKAQLSQAVLRIAGLGPGLTPSGDDFLVGYLLSMSYAARIGLETPRGNQTLKDIFLDGSTRKISVISNAYLKSAAGGERFSIIDDILEAALINSGDGIEARVKRLLRIGSSSGTDILCGIIWALKTLPCIWELDDSTYTAKEKGC